MSEREHNSSDSKGQPPILTSLMVRFRGIIGLRFGGQVAVGLLVNPVDMEKGEIIDEECAIIMTADDFLSLHSIIDDAVSSVSKELGNPTTETKRSILFNKRLFEGHNN